MKSLRLLTLLILPFLAACGSKTAPSPPLANYAGSWQGTYTITGCTQSGGVALANICGNLGASAPYRFNFTQNGTSVTGSFFLGTISFPSSGGTMGSDGSLALQATTINNGITIIVNWALHSTPNSVITGTVTQVWTSTTLSGQANVAGIIASATAGGGAVASTFAVPTSPATLESLSLRAAGK